MTRTQLDRYQEMKIQTASPQELLLITYDGALKAMRRARRACVQGQETKARVETMTALSAVMELNSTLNVEAGAIGPPLRQLYLYVIELLTQALSGLEIKPLDEAVRIMASLLESWQQAFDQAQAS
ncbi:MAG: flagellar export chaperone FliS [Armatimonadetes bacterium]|nr:flagellar export chaperone FliS [Armatimonadota bacterium]